ncbi:endonuclease/exonuclease/phosphatase family protein [Algoriphagus sediminis]|uniref:Endonuclease/exonuclease/phosphatase family protein n=1 Tax=Algoriphagus sediminis TaxID=3057113 RepID=A0ABT7YAP7_9BACT|nr:endonuclease/exonuclease/phosphatase family protein [Algoriphagus sediminis]MDN3203279.1 endonuclease/exonuclease/phosphatase family protein [Algoriphagus sediminis]
MIWVLRVLSTIILLVTFIPKIPHQAWWVRIYDYPRLQKLGIVLTLVILWIVFDEESFNQEYFIWLLLLSGSSVFLLSKILPFTQLGRKMIEDCEFSAESGIHLLIANVYQYNSKFKKVLDLINKEDPDLIFMVETDEKWLEELSAIRSRYPYQILKPLDNTYGLLFFSKHEIKREEINYLIDKEIPSIEVDIALPSGQLITLYGIHPTPPVPSENEKSTDRDAEILVVGKKAHANPKPCVVMGDLNDVAWSRTTELFLKISGLMDPRRGRGFYNTFHAKFPLFRWPLDHVFLSEEFGLNEIKVLEEIGSDHLPISIKACISNGTKTEKLDLDKEDKMEAKEKINKAKN